MTQCPDVIMCRSTDVEMWLDKVRLLSRVTPRVTILSERDDSSCYVDTCERREVAETGSCQIKWILTCRC